MAYLSARVQGEPVRLPTLPQLAAHLFYVQDLLRYGQINTIFWTLCYEVQFYLVLVGSLVLQRRVGVIVPLLLFAVAMLWGTGTFAASPGLFLTHWHCFFAGVLAYHGQDRRIPMAGLAILSTALIVTAADGFTMMSLATAWLLWTARRLEFMTLAPKSLLFLGSISYSLYLTHNPITGAVFYISRTFQLAEPVGFAFAVSACIALAWILWRLVEAPSMSLAHRVAARSHVATPTVFVPRTY
jgi:peptidoglycan/LPS O-acetylase OafA/YrhL